MLLNKTVAVVVPAYNEEKQIGQVIETMPAYVDKIIVVNDASTDKTSEVVKEYIDRYECTPFVQNKPALCANRYNRADMVVEEIIKKESEKFAPSEIYNPGEDSRVILINNTVNSSVGASISVGYKWCRDHDIDCTAVMAGDGQMDPDELEKICMPVILDEVDYVKANRLSHRSALFVIPKIRFFGNSILTLLTKIASGYWRVSDTQTGFTAIGLKALKAIRLHQIYPSYGCPNDILVKLNIAYCTIKEIPSKPVYHVGESSKMKELYVIPRISWLLFKSFWKRLYLKYLFRDFHPLFLLYHLAIVFLLISVYLGISVIKSIPLGSALPWQFLVLFCLFFGIGFQSLIFAMWMDMIDNERLYK
jgi:glycosyltransferase involved in cell wall biosynthesis